MDNQANHYLHIYKASAGSGKTFTLAVNFIRMLIEHPDDYRHILAVTFTNKATAEMKQRILSKLYGIAYDTPDAVAYFDEVKRTTHLPTETIRLRARESLDILIHDYSHFRVETIDSFFQSVLRGLARELELGNGMTIELDTRKVIAEAVDLLLRELKPGDAALEWIVGYIAEEIDEGKQWNITDNLKAFAANIHNEDYQRKANSLRTQLQGITLIRSLRGKLMAERTKARNRMQERAQDFFRIIDERGYWIDDFSNKRTGACGYYLKLERGEYTTELGTRARAAAEGPDGWVAKTSPLKKELTAFAEALLVPHINETHRICCECVPIVYTCDLILHHLNQLQLIDIIHDRVLRLNHEENRFLLADTCRMLSCMQQGDSSFVFEKLGYYIEHIMIDEFQDTSRMQWDNFFLLLLEGLSHGKRSLIVGDVKQAIYRWRGSDWRILNDEITEALSRYTPDTPHTLDTNRRSLPGIVEFNNRLFQQTGRILSDQLGDEAAQPLLRAYSDVVQRYAGDKQGGYVRITDVEPQEGENAHDAMCRSVLQIVEELRLAGIADEQMAILTRSNRQIERIVDYISKANPAIHILSADAYLLETSTAVSMMIAALRWVADENQRLALLQLAIDYHREVLADGMEPSHVVAMEDGYGLPEALTLMRGELLLTPLYELAERLYRILGLQALGHETGYVMTFFDRLLQFCTDAAGDLTAFLRHWDDELHKVPIPAGSNHGLEAMTIHKSKGLEFHTVILPYCEWELNKYKGILWVETDDPLGGDLEVIPVSYSTKMKTSIFAREHDEEYLKQIVDNYNLLYVACTRPKANLFILKSAEKKKEGRSAGKAAPTVVSHVGQLIGMALGADSSEGIIEYGTLDIPPKDDATDARLPLFDVQSVNPFEVSPLPIEVTMHSEQLQVKFRQSNQSKQYIPDFKDDNSQYMEQGLLLHEVLSRMHTIADAPRAIEQLVREGHIATTARRKEVERILYHALQLPQAAEWFSGDYELFNECSIIYNRPDGYVEQIRPDRVMKRGDRLIVVDFKFARPTIHHEEQVRRYMQSLHKMGHSHVEGYVWYGYDNRVVPVWLAAEQR